MISWIAVGNTYGFSYTFAVKEKMLYFIRQMGSKETVNNQVEGP